MISCSVFGPDQRPPAVPGEDRVDIVEPIQPEKRL